MTSLKSFDTKFFTSAIEAAAFGIFCQHVKDDVSVINCEAFEVGPDVLMPGFKALASRHDFEVLEDVVQPGRLRVEQLNTLNLPPEAYAEATSIANSLTIKSEAEA